MNEYQSDAIVGAIFMLVASQYKDNSSYPLWIIVGVVWFLSGLFHLWV